MKRSILLLLCLLAFGAGKSVAEDVVTTYVFTEKDWQATCDGQVANWTCGVKGDFCNDAYGIRITAGDNGANATSPRFFYNVTSISVCYCTNQYSGKGNVEIKIGSDYTESKDASYTTGDGRILKYLTYEPAKSAFGDVKITVFCGTNSIYIKSITITESIPEQTFVATDGTDYYATFSSKYNTVIPESDANATYSVFGVKVGANNVLQMTELPKSNGTTIVPANTGVLLKAVASSAPTMTYAYTGETNAAYDASVNDLVPCPETGTYKTEDDGNQYFKLAYGDNSNKTGLGFYWGANGGTGNFNVKEGGAILCVSGQQQVKGFAFADSEQLTGVEQMPAEQISGGIWNLNGQRLEKLQRGINILNGRKVYVK